jgi:cob(I)alamin adenosyltransferase
MVYKLYTGNGDSGSTRSLDGTTTSKDSVEIHAVGDFDELMAILGCCTVDCTETTYVRSALNRFYQLVGWGTAPSTAAYLRIVLRHLYRLSAYISNNGSAKFVFDDAEKSSMMAFLEDVTDRLHESLPELKHFVMPVGNRAMTSLNLARTVCRRAERSVVALPDKELTAFPIQYLNRLSSLLFAMSRWECHAAGLDEQYF